jgi:NAD(P)-dependent dehydrogenase (short-subunit alcohol dehydrogenase family)
VGNLTGKAAIVTGSSRGIGREIAKRLAKEGAAVILCARDEKMLDGAVKEIAGAGGNATSIALDLRVPENADTLVQFAVGVDQGIDILVNNAGATKRGAFLQLTDEDWADGFALKFFGAMRVTRAAWPYLKTAHGSVINISGSGGRTPGAEFAIGGSVNSAMQSFTKAIAELGIADGVQVNVINPGLVRTGRLQKRLDDLAAEKGIDLAAAEQQMVAATKTTRVGEPADIAALVAFIASPEGRFLQGAMIDMDGGATKTL